MKKETDKKKNIRFDLVKLEKTGLQKKQMTHITGGSCFCAGRDVMRPAAAAISY